MNANSNLKEIGSDLGNSFNFHKIRTWVYKKKLLNIVLSFNMYEMNMFINLGMFYSKALEPILVSVERGPDLPSSIRPAPDHASSSSFYFYQPPLSVI